MEQTVLETAQRAAMANDRTLFILALIILGTTGLYIIRYLMAKHAEVVASFNAATEKYQIATDRYQAMMLTVAGERGKEGEALRGALDRNTVMMERNTKALERHALGEAPGRSGHAEQRG